MCCTAWHWYGRPWHFSVPCRRAWQKGAVHLRRKATVIRAQLAQVTVVLLWGHLGGCMTNMTRGMHAFVWVVSNTAMATLALTGITATEQLSDTPRRLRGAFSCDDLRALL